MFFDAVPPQKMTRNTEDGDWNITGKPTSSFLIVLACIIVGLIFAFVLRTPNQKKSTTITLDDSQIASFRELYQKVCTMDGEIRRLEVELNSAEIKNGFSNPANVVKYYQQLSNLQVMRGDRSRYAQNYNGLARIHFTRSKTSPSELTTAKGGFLPTGIR